MSQALNVNLFLVAGCGFDTPSRRRLLEAPRFDQPSLTGIGSGTGGTGGRFTLAFKIGRRFVRLVHRGKIGGSGNMGTPYG